MRKLLSLLIAVCFISLSSQAQDPAIFNKLKEKYSLTRYRTECGGWYLLGYTDKGVNYYGFADKEGNIIASNAVKYKIHKGFIELEIFDELKKEEHDNWVKDMKQYERDMQNYNREETRYKNELKAYNERVAAAKQEAENRWNAARQRAYNAAIEKYRAQQKAQQQKQQSSSILGAVLTGLASGIGEVATGNAAAKQVAYQPFEDQVLGERGLVTEPSKPYNPLPSKPTEPSTGYEWKIFPLLQPCPYAHINYEHILDDEGLAVAEKGGAYGLINLELKEVLPCQYSSITTSGSLYLLKKDGKFGYANMQGKIIVPCEFEETKSSHGYLMCKKNDLWGIYTQDFEEIYPCQFSRAYFENIDNTLVLFAQEKGLWGVFDFETGKQLLPFSFGDIEHLQFANKACFLVKRDNKKGLYTSQGVLLLPCEFSDIKSTTINNTQIIETQKDNFVGLFDVDGIPILNAERYNSYKYIHELGFDVTINGKHGLCDVTGRELVACEYDDPIKYSNKYNALLQYRNNQFCFVGLDGKLPIAPIDAYRSYDASQDTYVYTKDANYLYSAYDYSGNLIVQGVKKLKSLDKKVAKFWKKQGQDGNALQRELIEKLSAVAEMEKRKTQAILEHRKSFSFYAQNFVERVVNDWQKKGEYEKMKDWQKRVNEDTRQQLVFSLTKEAQEQFIHTRSKEMPKDVLSIVGPYDPDNETFNIKSSYSNTPLTVHIPNKDAEEFKTSFSKVICTPKFTIENDGLGLAEYHFTMQNGATYVYRNDEALKYAIAKVDYNFDSIELDNGGKQGFSTTALTLGTSDVDVQIPVATTKQENTFAVIIANEKYDFEKNVEFAYNDGVIFKEYCTKALGIPSTNVHFVPNATLNQMRQQFNWIKKTAEDFNGEARFIIYYAGHGVPDDATKEAYLLPTDADGTDLEGAYKLSKLYSMLGEIPAQDVLVLMDACFSGSQRSGETLASARGIAIKPQIEKPKGSMVVYSAVTDKETAYPYREKVHGLFTYYLLKKIKETKGKLDLGTLSDYVTSEVSKKSIVVNKKSQHPTIQASADLANSWRNMIIVNQ